MLVCHLLEKLIGSNSNRRVMVYIAEDEDDPVKGNTGYEVERLCNGYLRGEEIHVFDPGSTEEDAFVAEGYDEEILLIVI
jgi:hypothetical protein